MSINIMLLFLFLSFCSFSVSSFGDDRTLLLKLKEQLGNPVILSSWVKGFDFCNGAGNVEPNVVAIGCSDSGRVTSLRLNIGETTHLVPFPEAICDFTDLEVLSVDAANIRGGLNSCFDKLVNLRSITITHTVLSSPVPEFLNHKNLTHIEFSLTGLYGPIPASYGAIPHLETLDLSMNPLNGTIPWEIFHHPPTNLIIWGNLLSGELPKCGDWGNMKTINLGGNRLRGDASFLFGKEKKFTSISLSGNQFEFDFSHVEIPENLTELDLSYNKINGAVPESLAFHPKLTDLRLNDNKLCGEIPQGGNMSLYPSYAFDNNACLCGSPLPAC